MKYNLRNHLSGSLKYFLIAWGILNVLQAFLTPLNNDEAYYWMYSKYPDWGYFDHPPMIAIMIKAGYFLIHNELGVRLLVVFSQIIALFIIWSLVNDENRSKGGSPLLFVTLISIFPVFNIYGFIATPDAPLILFSAVFLMAYKRFLEEENWKNAFILGVSMVLLVYSKYHGALLIIFVVVSNLKLLKNPKFYFASLLGAILFLPHIIWQYSNDFPSLKYHLLDRVSGFNFGNVPEYLMNQLVIHNPFILPVCIWLIIKKKSENQFEKTLNYIVVGFMAFFFMASFRYHIEPQWTALLGVPILIILMNKVEIISKICVYIKWVTMFFFPLLLFARLAFMIDFLPVSYLKKEYHNKKNWANEISKLADNRPVIFTNSYQDPSEYTFYTGKFAHSLNSLAYRKTQYDIWDFEEKVHNKEILYVPHFMTDYLKTILTKHIMPNGDSIFYKVFKNFQSLQKECVTLKDGRYTFSRSKTNTIHLQIFNPYPFQVDLKNNELPVVFQIAFIKNGYMEIKKNLELPENLSALNVGDTISVDCHFTLEDLPTGKYKLAICSETGILYDTYNSEFKDAIIIE